ncbi:PRC-barrel domain-containing protein [Vulcanisaeta distributa]|uniref:PRC-barrel domain-containing protein n=1 Tax=Vulcanisaeta distributa TaxID=164451 RepID=UPI000AB30B0E|nr:PRC-barrel domain-containing protein [Vulcanisaeta distributa]
MKVTDIKIARVYTNKAIRIGRREYRPGEEVTVMIATKSGSIVRFKAKVVQWSGGQYVYIPRAIMRAYNIQVGDEVIILSTSASNEATLRPPLGVNTR